MIGIPNLVSLSSSAMLCVFVGRMGLFFFGLFDVSILGAFFLVFNMKNFCILGFWESVWCTQILHLGIVGYIF